MKKDELDPRLIKAFNNLQNIPPRDPQAAQRGRLIFLHEAAEYRRAVSRKANQRQNWVSRTIFPLFQRKERFPIV